MSETVTITHEPEPDADDLHDAVTAALTEAEHRETVEETLEEIQGEQETWQSEMLEMQARTLSALTGMEATLSMLTIQREEAMAQASETFSEMQQDTSSPAPGPEAGGPVEEVVLVAPTPSPDSEQESSSSPPKRETNKFYSPLRNLLRARKQPKE